MTATTPVRAPLRATLAIPLALASAALLALALPGVEQWYLAFVALVPLLVVIQRASRRTALFASWLAGVLFFSLALYWIAHLTVVGFVVLALYLSTSFLVFAWALRFLTEGRPRLPFLAAAPMLWVALEYLRGIPLGGFYWHCLGHDFYRCATLLQLADVGGAAGLSLVAAAVNALIARAANVALSGELGGPLARRHLRAAAAGVAALLALVVVYGRFRLAESALHAIPGPVVSIVQANIPQELSEVEASQTWTWDQVLRKHQSVFAACRDLTLAEIPNAPSDLVVWPETMVWPLEGMGDCSTAADRAVRALQATLGRPLLVGSTRLARADDNSLLAFNGAYYFPSAGAPLQRYFKIHLVPFGEFIPFKDVGFIKAIVEWFMPPGYVADLTPGTEIVLFEVKGVPFAAPICYEDTNPALVREFRAKGARFIVNLTNDGWFRDSLELDQHLANAVFRTVENRVALVVAANTGISAVVSPAGVITARLEDADGRYRAVAGTLTAPVTLDDRRTLYTRLGDWPAWASLAVAGLAAGLRAVEGIRRRRLRE